MGVQTGIYHQEGIVIQGDLIGTLTQLCNNWDCDLYDHVRSFNKSWISSYYTIISDQEFVSISDHESGTPEICPANYCNFQQCKQWEEFPNMRYHERSCESPHNDLILTKGHFMKPEQHTKLVEHYKQFTKKLISGELPTIQEEDQDLDINKIQEKIFEWIDDKFTNNVVMIGRILMIDTN